MLGCTRGKHFIIIYSKKTTVYYTQKQLSIFQKKMWQTRSFFCARFSHFKNNIWGETKKKCLPFRVGGEPTNRIRWGWAGLRAWDRLEISNRYADHTSADGEYRWSNLDFSLFCVLVIDETGFGLSGLEPDETGSGLSGLGLEEERSEFGLRLQGLGPDETGSGLQGLELDETGTDTGGMLGFRNRV